MFIHGLNQLNLDSRSLVIIFFPYDYSLNIKKALDFQYLREIKKTQCKSKKMRNRKI